MTNLIDFITKTNNINGVSFVSLRNYVSSTTGEVANIIVNMGKNLYKNACAKDLKAIQNASVTDLYTEFCAKGNNIDFTVFQKAFNEVYNSVVPVGEKCIDGTTKVQNAYSKAHDVYDVVNNCVKVHKEKNRLYLYGLSVKKEVLVEGDYPSRNKQKKTICKDFIKKALEFKSTKFRYYIVEASDVINTSKTSFKGSELSITL